MVTSVPSGSRRRVGVVGAGMVGLSTAWFLQEHGIDVTVLERDDVAAGSSWGNAGWLTPGLTAPLPEPAVLAQGVRALLSPSSPVVVPRRPGIGLLRFLTGFARHSTRRQWQAGMGAYLPLNALALEAFDRLAQGGVQEHAQEADPFLACYRTTQDRRVLLDELEQIAAAGQDVKFEAITGEQARRDEPVLSAAVGAAIRIHGQRYIHPPRFMDALAASFRARGGQILTGVTVTHLRDEGQQSPSPTPPGPSTTSTPWSWPTVRNWATWSTRSACGTGFRPAAVTASPSKPSTCPQARSTSPRSGSPARPFGHPPGTGCESRE